MNKIVVTAFVESIIILKDVKEDPESGSRVMCMIYFTRKKRRQVWQILEILSVRAYHACYMSRAASIDTFDPPLFVSYAFMCQVTIHLDSYTMIGSLRYLLN